MTNVVSKPQFHGDATLFTGGKRKEDGESKPKLSGSRMKRQEERETENNKIPSGSRDIRYPSTVTFEIFSRSTMRYYCYPNRERPRVNE